MRKFIMDSLLKLVLIIGVIAVTFFIYAGVKGVSFFPVFLSHLWSAIEVAVIFIIVDWFKFKKNK